MKKMMKTLLLLLAAFVLVACGSGTSEETASEESTEATQDTSGTTEEPETVTVGVVSEMNRDIWEDVGDRLAKKENIDLEVVTFSDYVQPNRAIDSGDIDASIHQYIPFLYDFNQNAATDIVPIAYASVTPIGIWAVDGIESIDDIPEGAQIASTQDPVNLGNSLKQMENAGLIELAEDAGDNPTPEDIVSNPKNIEIVTMADGQVARSLGDVEMVVIGVTMANEAGLVPEDAIYMENPESISNEYKLVFAVQRDRADDEVFQKVLDEFQTPETEAIAAEVSNGAFMPAWSEEDTALEDYDVFVAEQEKTPAE